ncbi:unnamed protein product [Darwinula stevensoni]|uniref:Rho GTPase-activating protein 17 n=1 Tax=Darwinula stevensoni TaxID=69355 RepID=A0A7R9A871_9CRUS|nr:unnamed protein product [Darwinula stevensoni]CAG0895997.1 unnamed protein product [Darwinula stevensoni]
MKKQFFRVKQLADQTFSRAERTELLSDDLAVADRRVEALQRACHVSFKKAKDTVQGVGLGLDGPAQDKRLKKSPEYQLATALQQATADFEGHSTQAVLRYARDRFSVFPRVRFDRRRNDSPFREAFKQCGDVQMKLSEQWLLYETQVEQHFLAPLAIILDNEFPQIVKQKDRLKKMGLDMDSARSRYTQALRHGAEPGKTEALKEELDDIQARFEQCRDNLAADMFQVLSHEPEVAQLLVQLTRLQRTYHEESLKALNELLPSLESSIKSNPTQRVYGTSLDEHLKVTGRKIACPVETCVCALLETGLEEEGLFRVAGSASKLRRLKLAFDVGLEKPEFFRQTYQDPHVIAGALKSYLRELPEPVMTHNLYSDWLQAAKVQDTEMRIQALEKVLEKLPVSHRANLRYLVKFLHRLASRQDVNKMTPQNIAIVFAPNLLWGVGEDPATGNMNLSTANLQCVVVDALVTHANRFFPGEEEFYLTVTPHPCESLESDPGEEELLSISSPSPNHMDSSSSPSPHLSDGHHSAPNELPNAAISTGSQPASSPKVHRRKKPAPPAPKERPEKPPPPRPHAPASVPLAPSPAPRPKPRPLEQLPVIHSLNEENGKPDVPVKRSWSLHGARQVLPSGPPPIGFHGLESRVHEAPATAQEQPTEPPPKPQDLLVDEKWKENGTEDRLPRPIGFVVDPPRPVPVERKTLKSSPASQSPPAKPRDVEARAKPTVPERPSILKRNTIGEHAANNSIKVQVRNSVFSQPSPPSPEKSGSADGEVANASVHDVPPKPPFKNVSSTSEESEDDVPPPLPEKTRKHGSGEPITQQGAMPCLDMTVNSAGGPGGVEGRRSSGEGEMTCL